MYVRFRSILLMPSIIFNILLSLYEFHMSENICAAVIINMHCEISFALSLCFSHLSILDMKKHRNFWNVRRRQYQYIFQKQNQYCSFDIFVRFSLAFLFLFLSFFCTSAFLFFILFRFEWLSMSIPNVDQR